MTVVWAMIAPPQTATAQFFGFTDNKAATVGESHARGVADLIRSQSQANYTNAAAIGQLENARTTYLQNRALAAQTYMANKKISDEYREEKHAESRRKLAAYMQEVKQPPLTSSELYQDTGNVTWLPILAQPKYAEAREVVDKAFAKRAKTGTLSSTEYMQTSLLLNEWRRDLVQPQPPFTKNDAREAARFLNRLDTELKSDYQ